MSLEQKVFERIEKEDIRMLPKWFFWLRDFSIGIATVFFFVSSSVIFGIFLLFLDRWSEDVVMIRFPFFLLAVFLTGITASYTLFVRNLSFYKISITASIATLFLASFIMGYFLFSSGNIEKYEVKLKSTKLYQMLIPGSRYFYNEI